MRIIGLALILVLSVSFIFTGCKEAEEIVEKSEQMHDQAEKEFDETMPDKLAPEIWSLINTEDYKLKWKNWPGKDSIYVNPIAYEAIEKKEPEFPIGSTIVREKSSTDGAITQISVASRVGGNEETDGWFAADYAPDGEVLKVKKTTINIQP